MKPGQRLWNKEELLLAINLYSKLEFGKMHSRNPSIIELANLINRTPGAVAFKLVNFASIDPVQQQRGIKGADHGGNLDKVVWADFHKNWDFSFEQSEELLAKIKKKKVEDLYNIDISDIIEKGIDKKRIVKTRVNQYRFRRMVLANYNATCCITGLKQPELLIASHITLWSKYETNRLNPANGLCLNALHDKAFEAGLITINPDDYTVIISSKIKKDKTDPVIKNYFLKYEGNKILMPKKFLPDPEFLRIHNNHFK